MQTLTPKQRQDVSKLIQHGQKVAAVKYIVDHTHCSLQQAKMLADQIEQQPEILFSSPSTTSSIALDFRLNETQLDELIELIENGDKIKAIKYLVDHGGYSLQDAKQAVDLIEQDPDQMDDWLEPNPPLASSPLSYERIQVDYSKRTMHVIDSNGQKQRIDEQHPHWNQIMQQFYRRTYPSLDACFIDLIKRRNEVEGSSSSLESNNTSRHPNTFASRPVMPNQMHGIEDQTKKKTCLSLFCYFALD